MNAAARVPRLPEAIGDHGRTAGTGRVARLAVLGDSAAAGVGARTHEDALAGHLARTVTAMTSRPIDWRVTAESGATTHRIAETLVRDITVPTEGWYPDIVMVICGVNDLIGWRSLTDWRRDLGKLFTAIRAKAPNASVVIADLPPVDRFPILPRWLRAVAAYRLRAMNRILADTARAADITHITLDTSVDIPFSEDGLHLGPDGYRHWANLLAPGIASRLWSFHDVGRV